VVHWVPSDPWAFSFSAFGSNINTEISLGSKETLQGFVGFNSGLQPFIPENRPEVTDRLYFGQKKVFAGVRFPFTSGLTNEIQFGYMFDRSVYEGTQPSSNSDGLASIGNSIFVELKLRFIP
jgi:hypothetical protein